MDTVKIDNAPFVLATGVVIIIEISGRGLSTGFAPLLVTGIERIIDIAAILVVFYLFYGEETALGLSRHRLLPGLKRGIIWSAGFGMVAGVIGASLMISGIDPFRMIQVHMPDSMERLILWYLVGCVVGPVAEEMFFRGMVYGYIRGLLHTRLKRWGVPSALAVSTLFFAAAHQTSSAIPLFQLIGGIVFCVSYEYEKSLLTPIVIHSLGNAALFTLSLSTF